VTLQIGHDPITPYCILAASGLSKNNSTASKIPSLSKQYFEGAVEIEREGAVEIEKGGAVGIEREGAVEIERDGAVEIVFDEESVGVLVFDGESDGTVSLQRSFSSDTLFSSSDTLFCAANKSNFSSFFSLLVPLLSFVLGQLPQANQYSLRKRR